MDSKVALALAALVVIVGTASAQSSAPDSGNGCTLIVHVTGVRNQKGVIGGTLFKNADGWPEDNDKSYLHGPFPISGNTATVRFDHVPPGRYAVAVLHDENRNKKLDRNFLGIPKEGFGFANNPHVGLSAPKWEQAAIDVACPSTEIDVHMIYK